ncbi:hypothetical protein PV04_09608 [Phialophora macrospora]|uniref:Uncharacterized protein n=1 Tax=Phialophora macrospora TaxID=1851006 RepID=A0A0D2FCV0_9EURO|nr:hypothetical protein PV04_09608 [Phialophora macrospora]
MPVLCTRTRDEVKTEIRDRGNRAPGLRGEVGLLRSAMTNCRSALEERRTRPTFREADRDKAPRHPSTEPAKWESWCLSPPWESHLLKRDSLSASGAFCVQEKSTGRPDAGLCKHETQSLFTVAMHYR